MKTVQLFFTSVFGMLLLLTCNAVYSQEDWVSYYKAIPIQGYDGHHFRLSGQVRAEVQDDSAMAALWARVDKTTGYGFFENMQNRPIRSKEWKRYQIEGTIDSGSTQIAFGALCINNGKFYYDDIKLEIEKPAGNWTTVFASNFENNANALKQGISMANSGINNKFKAAIISGQAGQGTKSLLIEGKGVANYGQNKLAGKFADVNGIKLYYETYGKGTPLVVLHGNGGSIANATPFYSELMKKYKVIAVDNRAQGKSGDTDADLTYEQMAADVSALLDQLHIDSALIWGQSDGAILGLILAMDHPKKVKKVLSFGANIQPDSLAIFSWAISFMKNESAKSEDAKRIKLNKLMLEQPNIPYSKLLRIKAPVLIMSGDRDVIRPEHSLKLFQSIPNSHLCIVPGATHGASWGKKDLFTQLMYDFFDKPFTMPDTKDWFKE